MKLLTLLVCLYLLCCNYTSLAQIQFEQHLQTAVQNYKNTHYKMACKQYQLAFAINTAHKNDYYNAACACSMAKNKQLAFKYLHKSVKMGWLDIAWMRKDPDLDYARLHSRKWTKLEQKIERASKVVAGNK